MVLSIFLILSCCLTPVHSEAKESDAVIMKVKTFQMSSYKDDDGNLMDDKINKWILSESKKDPNFLVEDIRPLYIPNKILYVVEYQSSVNLAGE